MKFLADIARSFAGNFISPWYFALLALIPVVILLYLLKLKRTKIVISSTINWKKSIEDVTANAPFQKLRYSLLLLLQILILLVTITALARPFVRATGMSGNSLALIIDRSASMNTMEGDKSRLDMARDAALKMVDEMRGGDKMMIVAFAEKANVMCELTDDRARLRNAIRGVRPSDTRTNIREVVNMARSLAPDNKREPSTVPHLKMALLSDGRITDLDQLGALPGDMRFLQIGSTSDNAGITAFSARNPAEGKGERHCFVQVHNEREQQLDATLSLFMNEALIAAQEIHAPPRDDAEIVFSLPDTGGGVLRAELDVKDALAADNAAWLVLQPPSTMKVLLVSREGSAGAYFLSHVLALDPRVELSSVDPANYSTSSVYDLTIYENWSPKKLPAGAMLFINEVPPVPGVEKIGSIDAPEILAKDSRSPLMRFMNPGNVFIRRALRLKLPEGARTLLSTRGGPLIAELSRGGQMIVLVAFDLADSNWPLHLSFPLFFENVLSALPRASLSGEESLLSGHPLVIMPDLETKYATVTSPDGRDEKVELDPLRPIYFGATERVGVYQARKGGKTEFFAVNLTDRNESSITPAPSLKIGRGEAVAERGAIRQSREIWRWLILAGLVILGVEWWVYSRRAAI